MNPKGGDGMNDKMEAIRRAIRDRKLTAGDAQKALQDEIERELNQKPENIDMDVVNACEALLTELSGADEALHTEENRFAIRRQMRAAEKTPRRRPKAAAIAAALAAAVLAFGGTATVLGLAGNDHTRRLEDLQENRQVEAADMMSAARLTLSISPETLTLNQAAAREIADETGKLRLLAQTLTDVDGEGGVRMLLALVESAEELHVNGAYLVGFDADGKQMETAVEVSASPAILAGGKAVVTAEIEPGTMDRAERFELWLNIEQAPKYVAEEQDADAELRDHYFVATLTEDGDDGEEANGYVSIWATDSEGLLLDGFNASLEEGEQLLAGETWTFEKRIGSWVTPEQEDTAETGSAGYRLIQ